jgi:hypothetical protein
MLKQPNRVKAARMRGSQSWSAVISNEEHYYGSGQGATYLEAVRAAESDFWTHPRLAITPNNAVVSKRRPPRSDAPPS